METKNLLKSLKRRLSWLIMLTALLCGTQSVFGGTIPKQQYTYHDEGSPYDVGDFALTKIDNNHYKGSMVITGSSSTYCFTMKGADNKYYRNQGFWFGTNEEADISATDGNKMYISPKWTSGKIDVSLELYCEYGGNSKLIVKQTQHTADKCSNVDVTSILDGTNMMFYIYQDYNDNNLCIHNGSKYISGTKIVNKKAYINTAVSDIKGKTINVTNNCNNWTGTGGFNNVAAGSYLKTGNSGTSTVAATTLSTFSTPTSTVSVGAASVAIKTKASSTTSSYGDALKICFYIEDKSYGTCNATTTETSTNIDVSSLPAGTYTIKAVLSDSRIAYLDSKTITLTIAACTDPTATQYSMTKATKTYGSVTAPTITPASGAGTVKTVYYTGINGTTYTKSSTLPTNAGTYKVTVDVNAGDTYCAKNGIDLTGNFVINKASRTISITNSATTFCQSETPTVTSSVSAGGTDGTISYSIESGGTGTATINSSTGVITCTAPGTVIVKASISEGTNYVAAKSETKTFTFTAKPTAYAVSGTASICTGNSTDITLAGSQTGYTYKLYKGGSATSTTKTGTGSTLNFSVSEAGTYTVKGYVTGNESCIADMTDAATITINNAVVNPQPELSNIHPYEVVTFTADKAVTWAIVSAPTGVNIGKNAYFPWESTEQGTASIRFKGAKGTSGGYSLTATTTDGCATDIEFNIISDSEKCN